MQLRALTAAALLVLAGCASQPQKSTADVRRQHAMQLKARREKAARAQELKEQKMVLEMRKKLGRPQEMDGDEAVVTSEAPTDLPPSFLETQAKADERAVIAAEAKAQLNAQAEPATAQPSPAVPKLTTSQQMLPNRLPSKLSVIPQSALAALPPTPISVQQEQTGEHYLYSKILDTYRLKNAAELERTLALLMKSYPDSIFADNAVYLEGKLAFEAGDQKKALEVFDRVLREYPRSNKAVAALFAKAAIQKRLGHTGEAKREFIQVRDLYPGSPEAARVSVELQLLETMKRRES